ncbi:MAG: 4-(cytidine 5'-diphospho)-2-C-methyl-D-erythritol kinase [Clostridia bacterium]|nr:4-(cytidine 5'-diphospho)-2-C-methyl-D-erythritol kinase [Clostridia bacterium]
MDKIYIKARAKINLTLNVLNKRDDGYHNLESIFQKVNLYDELYIEKIKEDKFKLTTNVQEINNNQNIIYKAYIELKSKYNQISGVRVKLNKRIPMQAGLGGGSTDCASFILGINKLFKLNLSKQDMKKIGEKLGADVVPCLYNQPIKAEGKGEIITKIDTNCKYYILIIKPEFSCSTAKMYQKIDETYVEQQINTNKMIEALENNNIYKISQNLYNIFEEVIEERHIVDKVKSELIQNGAIGSLLCGSGSCIFGIFENKRQARQAYKVLKQKYNTYICFCYNRGENNDRK